MASFPGWPPYIFDLRSRLTPLRSARPFARLLRVPSNSLRRLFPSLSAFAQLSLTTLFPIPLYLVRTTRQDGIRPLAQVLLLPASQVRRVLHGIDRDRPWRLDQYRWLDPTTQDLCVHLPRFSVRRADGVTDSGQSDMDHDQKVALWLVGLTYTWMTLISVVGYAASHRLVAETRTDCST